MNPSLAEPLHLGEARPDVLLLGALLTLAIFVADLVAPLGIAGGVPYIAPVFLAMWLPDRRLIAAVALVCTLLVAAGLVLSPPGAGLTIVLTNRLLAVAAIWTVAVLAQQRKGVEAALARSEAAHRAVLATTADGVLTLDERGLITTANPAAEQMFGYDEGELRGRPFADLLEPEHRAALTRALSECRPRDEPPAERTGEGDVPPALAAPMNEMVGRPSRRASFPVEVGVVPVGHGAGARYTVTVRDITERRLLEQHLLRASDEERRALGYVLHEELGQSLTGLSLISRQLARRLETQNLAEAREANELAGLLRHVDQQALELFQSVAPLDAAGSFGAALDALAAATARRHGIPIEVHHAGVEAPADAFGAAHLYQLARDLLNAVSAGVEGVRVEAGQDGGQGWLRLHLLGPAPGDGGWAERLRPLAYRAQLIGVRLDLTEAGAGEPVVTCRWAAPERLTGAGA